MHIVDRSLIAVLALFSVTLFAGCADGGPGPSTEAASEAGVDAPRAETSTDVARRCTGFATSCSLLAGSDCLLARGCSREESCGGFASSCYGRGQYTCSSQEGCYWSAGSSGYCAGSARACELMDSYSCTSQSGCTVERRCRGVAAACEGLSEYACASQPGCRLEGG